MFRYLLILFFSCTSLQLSSQSVKFYAKADARRVVQESYITVEFTLENEKGTSFKAPPFTNFNVLSGPSRSSSFSSVNGAISQKMGFSYTIQAKSLGKLNIGSAEIKVKNKILKTAPIIIEVIKGSQKVTSTEEEIFVKVSVSDSVANVGQQIILDYKIYTTLDVRSINFLSNQEFEGFYAEQLQSQRSSYVREIVEGREYYTKSIKKIALFPQQTGTYDIDPVNINLGIASKQSSRSFFFTTQLIPRRIIATGLKIAVVNTPFTNLPSFSGAIGQYTMSVSLAKRSITTDEAIIVTMQINGNGDNKTVQSPRWAVPEDLEMYDPNVIEDEVFPTVSGISHRKKFEFIIVAHKPGKYQLTPTFTYFDPDSSKYFSVERRLPTINVIQGSKDNFVAESQTDKKLAGIYHKTKLKNNGPSTYGSFLHYIIIGLLIASGFLMILHSRYLIRSGKRNPDYIKSKRAYSQAKSRLAQAQVFLEQGDNKAFYEEIILALKKYLTDKHNIPALHLKKDEIFIHLSDDKFSPEIRDTLKNILDRSELALYSPIGHEAPREMYDQTLEVISNLES